MSYYAEGDGMIRFVRRINAKEKEYIGEIMYEFMDSVDFIVDNEDGVTFLRVWGSEKYIGDENVLDNLRNVAQTVPIESGEINYVGEEQCFWRFIFRDGEWFEEAGRIIYESDPGFHLPCAKPQSMDESWSPSDNDACSILY